MRARRGALVALGAALLTAAGAALAAPVPVLSISEGRREIVAGLGADEPLTYSYRQSIYQVTVLEQLARSASGIGIRGVRSSDIRSVEYFGWNGEPFRRADGLWEERAPATVSDAAELVIRITPAGEQVFATDRWTLALRPLFGETVVRVRAVDVPRIVALFEAIR